MNNHGLSELFEMVNDLRSHDRVFAGFLLHGFGESANVEVFVVNAQGEKVTFAQFSL